MSDQAYYNSEGYLLKKYASMSKDERKAKRAGFENLRKFHSRVDNASTVAKYSRFIRILDKVIQGD